ncbi:HAD-superfamily class IIA hydrolase, TIGR01459 [Roseovarius pacificus]|uniref:HAD-superfamily class IIA hydrolase, TIGR01459 n=1 Tax=Roseovarius pacificus TaxID=337701 RepID=A0A1M7A0C1_9RHOB|nr:HAD-IIA family hydrolase [Roseovarius pacificus]SHL35993.1 HAD-superfamily class IIA hydrolase, TIGR01459 [Roseovarius pacificus]
MMTTDAETAFNAYLSVRHRLPGATFGTNWTAASSLENIAEAFDLILLDAYGVLNVGETPIDGAVERIAALRAAGKRVMVVSNSAGYPKARMMQRYTRLGFDFSPSEVVTSREALLAHLASMPPRRWGMMLNAVNGTDDLNGIDAHVLADDPAAYDAAEGILLVGSDGWTDARQDMLENSLCKNPRPVIVGNPDIVAPREGGLSREPGYFAHRLADVTGIEPRFLGKPFGEIYDLALARHDPLPPPARVLMVGDTLHTDVLGGRHMGFATALVMNHGLLAGMDADTAVGRSGIVPDFVIGQI